MRPARAGPITRPRLYWADDSETAPRRSSCGHQVGHHRLVGREPDGAGRAPEEREQHEGPRRVVVEAGQHGQDHREHRFGQGGEDQPLAPVETVGQRPAHRGQEADGHEPGGGHQTGPARARRPGVGVDEDAERHRLHPRAQVGDQGRRPDEGEVPRAERAERSQGHGPRLPAPARPPSGPDPRARPVRLLVELDLAPRPEGEPPDAGHGGHARPGRRPAWRSCECGRTYR